MNENGLFTNPKSHLEANKGQQGLKMAHLGLSRVNFGLLRAMKVSKGPT